MNTLGVIDKRKAWWFGAVLAGLLLVFSVASLAPRSKIPPFVQVQSDLPTAEAEFLYAKANRQLGQTRWRGIWANLRQIDFKGAWIGFVKGPGKIQGVLKDRNGNVYCAVKYRDGVTSWLIFNRPVLKAQAVRGP